MKVLFVCLGNICRSPMAAGILRQMYKEHGIEALVDSAGTADWNVGQPADKRAVDVSLKNGIDIRGHRARQVQREDFDKFDLIVVMDSNNHAALRKVAPQAVQNKIRFLQEEAHGSSVSKEIADPYHGDRAGFVTLFDTLEHSCLKLIGKIKRP